MNSFRHHPDNLIYINDVLVPLEEFIKKNPKYSLPDGYIGREYVQGKYHRVFNGKDEEYLDVVWKEGDKYINEYSIYKTLEKNINDKIVQDTEMLHEQERQVYKIEKKRIG